MCVFKLNTPRRSSDPERAIRMPMGIRKRGARRADSGPDANEVMSRAIISGINATPVIKELTPVTACKNIGMMKTIPARLRRKSKFAAFPALYARARKSVMSVSGTLWWRIRRRCHRAKTAKSRAPVPMSTRTRSHAPRSFSVSVPATTKKKPAADSATPTTSRSRQLIVGGCFGESP